MSDIENNSENSKLECEIDECGTKFWYRNGILHRKDGPAIEFASH